MWTEKTRWTDNDDEATLPNFKEPFQLLVTNMSFETGERGNALWPFDEYEEENSEVAEINKSLILEGVALLSNGERAVT